MDSLAADSPLPPPLPLAEPPAPREPFGFWATTGLGVLAMGAMIAAQAVVAFVYVIVLSIQHQAEHGQPIPTAELMGAVTSDPLMLAISVFFSVPVVFLAVWGMIWLRRGPTLVDYLGVRGFGVMQFLLWTVAMIAVVFAGSSLASWLGDDSGMKFALMLFSKGDSVPLLIAALVIGAPLVEELLFRGFMYRGMAAARWAPLGAIVIPNILWASLHVQYSWPSVLALFSLGLVLGAARHFSGSTVLPFVLHVMNNAVSTGVALAMLSEGTPVP